MANLLLIEPDPIAGEMMLHALEGNGHHCTLCANITIAEKALQTDGRKLTILNTSLPWSSSSSFLHAMELRGLPVLFITDDAASVGMLKAMYQSRCSVLLAPYSGAMLLKAVDLLLETEEQLLKAGDLCMNLDSRTVTRDGESLPLTAQEFALLHALMASRGAAVTREELLRTAWGYQGMGITRTVDVHIQRLRRKLGSSYIETIYKTGYRLCTA